ncbi:efflux RND transporter periplasmic adaptor subunit [Methylosinus sporium]|uniref:efflux RND transporter periplasmic adaptor subunit n=1 Tax=Methylosinus sporium TaxID=428 RepID=UPI00383AD9E9
MSAFYPLQGFKKSRFAALAVFVVAAYLVVRFLFSPAAPHYLTEKAARVDLETSVLATGALQATRQVDVGTRVTGQLKSLRVALGDHVRAGDLLAIIDPVLPENDLRSQQANLARLEADRRAAIARQKKSKLEFDRQKGMIRGDATSRRDLQAAEAQLTADEESIASLDAQITQACIQIETAAANLGYTKITAPIDGDIVAILTREGQTVVASQIVPVILKLADLDAMTVKTQISEGDVTRVRVGQTVSFSILSEPDKGFSGVLRAVEPAPQSYSEPATAAAASSSTTSGPSNAVFYNALFDVANPDRLLRIGMTAQVSIRLGDARNVLAIPAGALREKIADGRFLVRVLGRSGATATRRIRTGVNNHIQVEVLEGLSEGEEVVVGERLASAPSGAKDEP